ncbi:MAG: hypothetical protein R6W75_02855 [Smithellaceae bacterium]
MQEILVVAAIAAAIFFLPRWLGRKPEAAPGRVIIRRRGLLDYLPGWIRLAIVITFLWVAGSAAYLKPWEADAGLFVLICLLPVVAFWGGVWAWFGYKKFRR